MLRRFLVPALLLVCLTAQSAEAETAQFTAPALDRWMYPFNGTPGTRSTASLFGNTGNSESPSFDQRDAQFVVGFDTGAGSQAIPVGQGAAAYDIHSATLTVTVMGGAFEYDPTYDGFASYLPTADVNFQADADVGRPLELYGVGFRNGYSALSLTPNDNLPSGFEESTLFGTPGPPARSVRHAFAASFAGSNALIDVSNNVAAGFDPTHFGIGQMSLTPGAVVPAGTVATFALDVADPWVRSYLQAALDAGLLGLTVSGFHAASQGGPATYPILATRENSQAGVAPQLVIDYSLAPVPEPATWILSVLGIVCLCLAGYSRRRRPMSSR